MTERAAPLITRSAPFFARRTPPGVYHAPPDPSPPLLAEFFETFSFLPPLTGEQISKQVDFFIKNGLTPCLEFSEAQFAYVSSEDSIRFGPVSSGYQNNRYWTMWKLPMFGCTDGGQVLKEVAACEKAFPDAYIRLVAFDNVRQVQIAGFLVHRPKSATDFCAPSSRSI
jgi:ribulose-bisphosphate carboxylase small chain